MIYMSCKFSIGWDLFSSRRYIVSIVTRGTTQNVPSKQDNLCSIPLPLVTSYIVLSTGKEIRRDNGYILDAPERKEQSRLGLWDRDRLQGGTLSGQREESLQDALVLIIFIFFYETNSSIFCTCYRLVRPLICMFRIRDGLTLMSSCTFLVRLEFLIGRTVFCYCCSLNSYLLQQCHRDQESTLFVASFYHPIGSRFETSSLFFIVSTVV